MIDSELEFEIFENCDKLDISALVWTDLKEKYGKYIDIFGKPYSIGELMNKLDIEEDLIDQYVSEHPEVVKVGYYYYDRNDVCEMLETVHPVALAGECDYEN
jgi:hypothetical protein